MSIAGRVGALVRICAVLAVHKSSRGGKHGASCGGSCNYHLRETEACNRGNCGTVAPLIVAAAAVDQDMVGLVVSKVSRDNGIFAIICVR